MHQSIASEEYCIRVLHSRYFSYSDDGSILFWVIFLKEYFMHFCFTWLGTQYYPPFNNTNLKLFSFQRTFSTITIKFNNLQIFTTSPPLRLFLFPPLKCQHHLSCYYFVILYLCCCKYSPYKSINTDDAVSIKRKRWQISVIKQLYCNMFFMVDMLWIWKSLQLLYAHFT